MSVKTFLVSCVLSLGCALCSSLSAQDTVQVNEQELLQKLANSNWELRIAEQEYLSARADYRQSNGIFLPQVELSYTAMTTNNPLMAFGSKLNQEIVSMQDFNPALLNDPDRIDNFATELAINQPLINVDGIYQRKAAKAKMRAMQLKSQRTQKGMKIELKKAYMMLQLSYKGKEVVNNAVEMAKSGYKMVSDYYQEGMVQKADVLMADLHLKQMQTKQQAVQNQILSASNQIAYLVGDSSRNMLYQPKDGLDTNISAQLPEVAFSVNRTDIAAMESAAEAYHKMAQASKMSFLPRLNAFGRYQLYDDEPLQADANGYLVGARLSWSLFNGYQNAAKSEKAKIEYQKAQDEAEQYKSKSASEFAETKNNLQLAIYKVKQEKLAVEQAEEAYQIRKDRFSEGLEKTTDLLQAETQLYQSEMGLLKALFEYHLTHAYLEFLTQ
ncbi:MAG: TolC family protein [Vicingaceae bacterium]